MKNINLAPSNLAPEGSFVKLSNTIKRITILGFVVYIVLAIGLLAYFIVVSSQINASLAKQEKLTISVRELEPTEQALILVKDRVAKSKVILGRPSASDEVVKSKNFIQGLDQSIGLSNAEIGITGTSVGVTAGASSSMVGFMRKIVSDAIFSQINLTSLDFKPSSGYSIDLNFSNSQ